MIDSEWQRFRAYGAAVWQSTSSLVAYFTGKLVPGKAALAGQVCAKGLGKCPQKI